ncbi:hypothetical protein KTH71_10010 [Acinetobacter sp. WU_MDCI_Axc73]|nr:hypothetical protein [Acinetobacter sp. WU_MDCI_Axc73]
MLKRHKKPAILSENKNTWSWSNFFGELLGELFTYALFAILVGLGGGIYIAYTFLGIGSLLLILPYVALIYYLYKKLNI